MPNLKFLTAALGILTFVQPTWAVTCVHRQEGIVFELRAYPLRGRLNIRHVEIGAPAIEAKIILLGTNVRLVEKDRGFEISGGAVAEKQEFKVRGGAAQNSTEGIKGRLSFYLKTASGELTVVDAPLLCK